MCDATGAQAPVATPARFEMKHLTPYRLNETSLSPVRGKGMGYGVE